MNTVLPARVSFCRPQGGFAGSEDDPLAVELEFTRVYRENHDKPAALRELRCLEVLLPARFQPPRPGDRLVGRVQLVYCGLSPQASGARRAGGFAYYCNRAPIESVLAATPGDAAWREEVAEMLAFWETENTAAKTRAALPADVNAALLSDDVCVIQPSFALYRLSGTQLDYAKLVRLGLPGLRTEVETAFADLAESDTALRDAFLGALRLLGDVAEQQAAHLCDSDSPAAAAIADANERERMIAALDFIPRRAPETFREAVQLVWLAALASGSLNYGRLDEVLGSFLAHDLDAGLLTEEDATELLASWWRLMDANSEIWNHRVIVGGRGRTQEPAADRFALLAMEASRRVRLVTPQLTLRFHAGQNPALMAKALDVLSEGITFPMLYNDAVNVSAVMEAMSVTEAEAIDYLPYGCGEYILWRRSLGTPSGAINLAKCLELALNDGHCLLTGKLMGPRTGAPETLTTFETVWEAFVVQMTHGVRALAHLQKIEYEVGAREAAFLYISLLMDDCIARGKAVAEGGVRHLGGTLETYGNTDVGDALMALRRAVYEQRFIALPELVAALRRNWKGEGDEDLRQRLLALPKFGNDDDTADAMAVVRRDAAFYRGSGGGLTVSGGEPTFQTDFCVALLRAAKAEGLHTCLDTSGFFSAAVRERVRPWTDLFLFDWKVTGEALHRELTGVPKGPIEDNLTRLLEAGAAVWLRCPMVPTLNDQAEHFAEIAALSRRFPAVERVDILPYHRIGAGKRRDLGMQPISDTIPEPDEATRARWRELLAAAGARGVTGN